MEEVGFGEFIVVPVGAVVTVTVLDPVWTASANTQPFTWIAHALVAVEVMFVDV